MRTLCSLLPQITLILCPRLLAQQRNLTLFEPQHDYESDKQRLDGDVITRPNNGFTPNYIYGFYDSSLWLCHYLELKKFKKKKKDLKRFKKKAL